MSQTPDLKGHMPEPHGPVHEEICAISHKSSMDEGAPSRRRIITLRPDQIHWPDWAKRTCVNEAFIDALAEDMAKRRQEDPIKVRLVEGRYEGVAGYQRWLAASKAGLPALDCELIEADEREAYVTHAVENAYRRDLHPLDLARKLEYGHKVLGMDLKELAQVHGLSYNDVRKIISLTKLDEDLKAVVQYCTIDWTKLYELKRVKDRKTALEIAGWIVSEDPSVKEVKARIDALEGRYSGPSDVQVEVERQRAEDKLRPERCFLCGDMAEAPKKTMAVFHKDCKAYIARLVKEGRLKPPSKAG